MDRAGNWWRIAGTSMAGMGRWYGAGAVGGATGGSDQHTDGQHGLVVL